MCLQGIVTSQQPLTPVRICCRAPAASGVGAPVKERHGGSTSAAIATAISSQICCIKYLLTRVAGHERDQRRAAWAREAKSASTARPSAPGSGLRPEKLPYRLRAVGHSLGGASLVRFLSSSGFRAKPTSVSLPRSGAHALGLRL